MPEYEVGDRVIIGELKPLPWILIGIGMPKWVGKTMTIRECRTNGTHIVYRMEEDIGDCAGGWSWAPEWIQGFAEPNSSVNISDDEFEEVLLHG